MMPAHPQVPLRPPETVMRLSRMGAFHQTRLSFMRVLLRRMAAEGWRVARTTWEVDGRGVGVAVYTAHGPGRSYSLVCFAHDLPPDRRSDRVIATAWDATFTLHDGIPDAATIKRLADNVPRQEAGRVSEEELVLARANRSVRLFEHVVASLAGGQQPDVAQVTSVGYLMRTTAVYGSGKFGAADREVLGNHGALDGPFRAEMLAVYLIRLFSLDMVEHLARSRAPATATALAPDLRRRFGIGNATGLGMAPFLINHPTLLNNWMMARETALARVRALSAAGPVARDRFHSLLGRATINAATWQSAHPLQSVRVAVLREDLAQLAAHLDDTGLEGVQPWDGLYRWAEENLSVEGQEQLVSLLLEPYPELVDELAGCMSADEARALRIDGAMTVDELRAHLESIYDWALEIDFEAPAAREHVWYVSEEKLEPRLGPRFGEEDLESYEQPLAPGRDAAYLHRDLVMAWPQDSVAAFLLEHPRHRHTVRRLQIAIRHPYAEIRDNTIGADLLPIDLLRCKLSFFGATHFDPRSDRWVQIVMYQGAPFPDELDTASAEDWSYPPETAPCLTP